MKYKRMSRLKKSKEKQRLKMAFLPNTFYKKIVACGALVILASINTPLLRVTAADNETAELDESLSEKDLRELIQPFSRMDGEPVYEVQTLELAFDALLNTTNLSLLTRGDVHRMMDKPSMTQHIAGSVIDTYQATADLHTIELHFAFEEDNLLLIQRDEHLPSIYQTQTLDSDIRQTLSDAEALTLTDLIALLGPPSTSYYYVVQSERVFVWQSMVQSDIAALIVTMNQEGNVKFTYLPK